MIESIRDDNHAETTRFADSEGCFEGGDACVGAAVSAGGLLSREVLNIGRTFGTNFLLIFTSLPLVLFDKSHSRQCDSFDLNTMLVSRRLTRSS